MNIIRLWKKDAQIIDSLLEVDVYKYRMLYFIWSFFPDLWVTFAFNNRTKSIKLGKDIDIVILKEQIAHVKALSITDEIVAHLRLWGDFSEDFLSALMVIKLPEPNIEVLSDGQLKIEVEGLWMEVTLWETIILSITNELYARSVIGEDDVKHQRVIKEAEKRLLDKMNDLHSLSWMISLFGLRRRLTGVWERRFTEIILNEIEERIVGVSNIQVAKEFGVLATGTNAHELPMALYALRSNDGPQAVYHSQYEVLEKWQSLYSGNSLIMLSDTFGSEQFFSGLPLNFLKDWVGTRQDSGNPFDYGNRMIDIYHDADIDPLGKLTIFSDGLDVQLMMELHSHFVGRLNGAFGWGTNGTNDTGYVKPLSLVMKLVAADGNPAVKLSDNRAKATGSKEEVEVAKQIFHSNVNYFKQPTY